MDSIINGRELTLSPMNAGDDSLSYVQNSSYQRGVLDVAKPIIEQEIAKRFDIEHMIASIRPVIEFTIADFGCSTGNNSFPAIHIIIEAVRQKHESSLGVKKTLEFQVFFNDLPTNDFNTLYTSLPPHRNYHATTIPGDFHRRLLPESSLHIAYSSWSLHWLTEVPKAVVDRDSPAWNKGQILYSKDRNEVCEEYLKQFEKDMKSFLKSRAIEMVGGGLMTLLLPGDPALWDPQTEYTLYSYGHLLGSCLMDMAKKGRISEADIDSFNLPYYFTTPEELKAILEESQSFTIERMEILNNPGKYNLPGSIAPLHRAVHEGLLTNHFSGEMIDELFEVYTKKLAASSIFLDPNNDKSIMILVVLKRKMSDENINNK